MKGLSGDAFDQAYIKEMVKAHKEDDKAFKEEAKTTTSPQLKEMVTQDLQMIESHLQQVQQIADPKAAKASLVNPVPQGTKSRARSRPFALAGYG